MTVVNIGFPGNLGHCSRLSKKSLTAPMIKAVILGTDYSSDIKTIKSCYFSVLVDFLNSISVGILVFKFGKMCRPDIVK